MKTRCVLVTNSDYMKDELQVGPYSISRGTVIKLVVRLSGGPRIRSTTYVEDPYLLYYATTIFDRKNV